jgi:flagella basal body P-ring formation protein FlgA
MRRTLLVLFLASLSAGFVARVSADEVPAPAPTATAPRDRAFGESDLLALLTATLQQDYVKDKGELELRCVQPWKTRNVPDEPLTVKILDLPNTGVGSAFIVRFELRTASQIVGSWQLPVQGRIWREVWIARAPLKRGDLVADSDITRERRDILSLHEPLANFEAGDTSLELTDSVQAGTPLLARAVKARPVIHRGQIVDAVVQDGALNITMKVEVLEDGAPGQMIRARNSQSRRDILGKVLNEQTILVSL